MMSLSLNLSSHVDVVLLGIALRLAGQNFFKTSGSIADVAQTLMEPRGLGFRLKDAVLMENLIDGKQYAKSLILGKANVNVSLVTVHIQPQYAVVHSISKLGVRFECCTTGAR